MSEEAKGFRTIFATAEFAERLGTVRLVEWPEGLVLWAGGKIAWKSWDNGITVKLSVDATGVAAAIEAAVVRHVRDLPGQVARDVRDRS